MRSAVCILIFISATWAYDAGQKAEPTTPAVERFAIGRHTYFDIGPPFDFYEVIVVESTGGLVSIDRITVTPAGHICTQPATTEAQSTFTRETIMQLLGGRNPCAIPAKKLQKELKRCKKCLVFSGADVMMRVRCGSETRDIRADILDRDMFDAGTARTPEHTSWIMGVLSRLDQALGSSVMDRPAFTISPATRRTVSGPPSESIARTFDALKLGQFDGLFANTRHKLSAVYLETQRLPVVASVEIVSRPSIGAVSYPLSKYPPLAKAAHIEGQVAFTLGVAANGSVSNVNFITGHPILRKGVESDVTKWRFPAEASGRTLEFVIEFRTNCPSVAGHAREHHTFDP